MWYNLETTTLQNLGDVYKKTKLSRQSTDWYEYKNKKSIYVILFRKKKQKYYRSKIDKAKYNFKLM